MRSPEEQEDFLNRGRFGDVAGDGLVHAGILRRLLFAFCGLLAGDAVLLLGLFPGFPGTKELFEFYGILSLAGWTLVGLPLALLVPAYSLRRLSWSSRLLLGAALGPAATLAMFLILAARARASVPMSLAGIEPYGLISIFVSTPAFIVYTALLRRKSGLAGTRSDDAAVNPP